MKSLVISTRAGVKFITHSDILYLHAMGAYCCIKTIDGQDVKVAKNLNFIHNLLMPSTSFMKVHRSWVVNKNYVLGTIKSDTRKSRNFIQMKCGDIIPIATGAVKYAVFDMQETLNKSLLQETIDMLLSFSEAERLYIIEQAMYPTADKESFKDARNVVYNQSEGNTLPRLPPISKQRKHYKKTESHTAICKSDTNIP